MQDGATSERETKQGKDMIDGALANNVQVFVYSSVDRGESEGPTFVPHFISKYNVENHLKEQAQDRMTWTILRPVAFMEGLSPDFMGKIMATWIKISLKPSKRLAFVATSDIGFFAAQGFLQPENPEYKNQAISLAGDELTFDELSQVFKQKQGYGVPTTFEFVGRFIKWMVTELNVMFKWFDEEGYKIDIPKLKKLHPELMNLGDWLEKEGGFPVKK